MRALVVSINGRRVGTAGIGPFGLLGAQVFWMGTLDGPDGTPAENCFAHLMGIDHGTSESLGWPMPPLAPGDVVTIAIVEVEADEVDPPASRSPFEGPGEG